MKLWTQEWADASKAKTTDPGYLKNTKGLTLIMQNLIKDCPGGKDRLAEWDFEDGKVKSVKVTEDAAGGALRAAPFDAGRVFLRSVADYPTYVSLHKGEMTAAKALTGGAYVIEGDMMKIMGKLGPVNVFNKMLSDVAAEY